MERPQSEILQVKAWLAQVSSVAKITSQALVYYVSIFSSKRRAESRFFAGNEDIFRLQLCSLVDLN